MAEIMRKISQEERSIGLPTALTATATTATMTAAAGRSPAKTRRVPGVEDPWSLSLSLFPLSFSSLYLTLRVGR